MEKHMLMKGPDGPFTVPLLAKNNKLIVTVGGHNVQLTASIERWFVYHLYVGEGKGIVIRWFREVQYVSCLPQEYDAFISQFIQEHPKTTVESYSLDIIPMQADSKIGLALPIPYYECLISEEDEKELMDLFINSKTKYQTNVRLVNWFKEYCRNYGYCFPKCEGEEYEYLYNAFLEQHGISSYAIRELEEANAVATRAERKARQAEIAASKPKHRWVGIVWRAIIVAVGYPCLAAFLIDYPVRADLSIEVGGFMQFIGIVMLIGIVWLFFPFLLAKNETENGKYEANASKVRHAVFTFICYGFKRK